MAILMVIIFIVGYALIALEHPLKINKSATSLILGVLLWTCVAIGGASILIDTTHFKDFVMNNPGMGFIDWIIHNQVIHALGDVSQILFFLLGAMTIVELIDTEGGFKIISNYIKTTNKVKLLWVVSLFTFFLSAVLDNLTTSIVMVAIIRKLINNKHDRWFFASMIILAANSGGAWSPIGDVTTIMLWVAGKVSALSIMQMTILASITSIVVPLIVLSFILKGEVERPALLNSEDVLLDNEKKYGTLFLILGVGFLLFTPIFKTITHLPPFLGILGGLGCLWVISEIIHRKDDPEKRREYAITTILTKVDTPSILFFLGILMAVNALQTVGHLGFFASKLDTIPLDTPEKYYLINILIGIVSSIVDNVPLVAAAMGMYNFPMDHYFWEFLAYCAGTGGSILIIGSAAGVAVMGMEKIDFIWYLKHISWIALIGYFAGCGVFILEHNIRNRFNSEEGNAQTELVLTEEGITDFMNRNTFYLTQSMENVKDSTVLRFFQYTEKEMHYCGIDQQNFINIGNNDSLYFFNDASNLTLGDIKVDVKDTVAHIMYGENYFILTQSGTLYTISENNVFPLKRVDE